MIFVGPLVQHNLNGFVNSFNKTITKIASRDTWEYRRLSYIKTIITPQSVNTVINTVQRDTKSFARVRFKTVKFYIVHYDSVLGILSRSHAPNIRLAAQSYPTKLLPVCPGMIVSFFQH